MAIPPNPADKPNRFALTVVDQTPAPAEIPVVQVKPFQVSVADARQFLDHMKEVLDQEDFAVSRNEDTTGFYDADFENNRNAWSMGKIRNRLEGVYNLFSSNGSYRIRIHTTAMPMRFTHGLLKYRMRTVVIQQTDGNKGALKWVEPANWLSALCSPMACYSQLDPAKKDMPNPEQSRIAVNLETESELITEMQETVRQITTL